MRSAPVGCLATVRKTCRGTGRAAAFLAAVTLTVAGCGSAKTVTVTTPSKPAVPVVSDQDQAKSAVADFLLASVHPSGKLCDVVSQRVIEQRTGLTGAAALAKCRENADKAGKTGGNGNTLPHGLQVTDVTLTGTTGTVSATAPGQGNGTFHVVKENGRWKVDSAGR